MTTDPKPATAQPGSLKPDGSAQLCLMLPGEWFRHRYSDELVCVSGDQSPVPGLDWIYERGGIVNVETLYGYGRVPMYACTLVAPNDRVSDRADNPKDEYDH